MFRRGLIITIAVCGFSLPGMQAYGQAGEVFVPGIGTGFARVKVQSIKERREAFVVKQKFDFSCGSAAVATLLTHHYGVPTTESDAFIDMWERGNQAEIQKVGFSLLDIQGFLVRQGFKADGFQLPLDKVREIGIPAIALIDLNGYKHFVVIKGLDERHVLVGDPSLGLYRMRTNKFAEIWNGIVFVIRSRVSDGRESFNKEEQWAMIPKTPLPNPLSTQTLDSLTTFVFSDGLNFR